MTALSRESTAPDSARERYRHNFSRHLLGVARYLQASMMNTLQEECGHANLRLGFAPYITLIGEGEKRLTDLAEILGVSRQACNQTAKQVEAAGYIERRAHPTDGRARRLALSSEGIRLRRDGIRIVAGLDRQLAEIAGEARISDASQSLSQLYRQLRLGLTPKSNESSGRDVMGGLLPRLSDYSLQRLMELTRDKGHPGLKLSFGQVLTMIGPSGGRIQQMAAIHDVSKQAISAIATELELLGYLRRETDPQDARQRVLRFTSQGDQLIADSVLSVTELEAELGALIGEDRLQRVSDTLRALYLGLGLEQEVFETDSTVDIGLLAHRLQQQLGEQTSQALGRLLLSPLNPRGKQV
ncbi:MarR family winged helix-turn-helix transcriptional regulator [Candidatus Marimicrobium litorale]|nr:MarR family transcriptional regulator [Candidatus Marimicrobium litorale]